MHLGQTCNVWMLRRVASSRRRIDSINTATSALAAALAIEMNNSEAGILRDYRELASPSDVDAWWKIAPADEVIGLFRTTASE